VSWLFGGLLVDGSCKCWLDGPSWLGDPFIFGYAANIGQYQVSSPKKWPTKRGCLRWGSSELSWLPILAEIDASYIPMSFLDSRKMILHVLPGFGIFFRPLDDATTKLSCSCNAAQRLPPVIWWKMGEDDTTSTTIFIRRWCQLP
jgi:hypothetical protein